MALPLVVYTRPWHRARDGNPADSFSALPTADRNAAIASGFTGVLFNGNLADDEAGTVLQSTANTRDVTQDSFLIRSDHQLSSRLNLSVRYAFAQPSASVNNCAVAGVVQENRHALLTTLLPVDSRARLGRRQRTHR